MKLNASQTYPYFDILTFAMNKDKLKKIFSNPDLRAFYSEIGKKGGSVTSDKKAKTSRKNGLSSCAPGKFRGRPPNAGKK